MNVSVLVLFSVATDLCTAHSAVKHRYKYDQPGLQLYAELENILLQSDSSSKSSAASLIERYPEIDFDRLIVQLPMFQQQSNSKCSSVDEVASKLVSLEPPVHLLFSDVEHLTKLFLTIPVSNAEAERSFSCLRRLKTYLRSNMGQDCIAAVPRRLLTTRLFA